MALIWLVYLHLFLLDHRRRKRPYLIIHHAQGLDPGALCLFVNMSEEPVHVQCVIADIDGSDGLVRHYITEYRRITPDDRNVQGKLRQGPIQPGGYLTLGSFEDIIFGRQSEAEEGQDRDAPYSSLRQIDSVQIGVAVKHGPSKFDIGARRRFLLERDGDEINIRPLSIDTEQMVSRRKRKLVREWVESSTQPKRRAWLEAHRRSQAV